MTESREDHWERIYTGKPEAELSWYQSDAGPSLELFTLAGVGPDEAVIDIGGGPSRFADGLIARGIKDVSVLDVSKTALDCLGARLALSGGCVTRIVADVTTWTPPRLYDLWHDRAVFHFLVEEQDRAAYLKRLDRALRVEGHAIIATFAPGGPETCSGLPVMRYSPETLSGTLGTAYAPLAHRFVDHETPSGAMQAFQFSLFRKIR